ncbi:MAG: S1C family serine protease [Actinomycetota bacterium]
MKRFVPALVALSVFGAACSSSPASSATTSTSASPTAADSGQQQASFPTASPVASSGGGVVGVVKEVMPAVVNVVSTTTTGTGEGTGFVVRSDGVIVTNFHVVEGATKVTVLTSAEKPVKYDARVIGGDATADVAVLKIDGSNLATVPMGDSAKLQLGQSVVAIGYALGLQGGPSVTAGVVSSLTRQITVPDPRCTVCSKSRRVYGNVVQTDAAINPGNSGGPLVNLAGQVVGINTAGVSAGNAENVGFAIQIDAAKPIVFQAAEHPQAPVAFLGVGGVDASNPQIQFELNPPTTKGVAIVSVAPGGPADKAGIRVGDIVVAFDGKPISSWDALGNAIRAHRPGDRVDVTILQRSNGWARKTVTVTLGTNPVPQT